MLTVLSLCDYTGNMVKPWADAGCRCLCYDLKHPEGFTERDGIHYVGCDLRTLEATGVIHADIIFAFPPCTHTAVSGARWFKSKGPAKAAEAFGILSACLDIIKMFNCPWMVENPVSTFSTYWREPDYRFDPCEYAIYADEPDKEAYTKKTCLWTGNGFVMPEKKSIVPILGSKMHMIPPGPDRADIRSETPKGFAKAVFMANYERIKRGLVKC
jgi:hypothetical protein